MSNVKKAGNNPGMLRTFITTLCHGVLFGAIFLAYLVFIYTVFIHKSPKEWILAIAYIGLPVLLAIVYCFIKHRNSFKFRIENMTNKHSVLKIVSRVIGILVVLIIGYIIDASNVLSSIAPEGYGYMIMSVLGNFNFYICVSLFLLVFSLVEYAFVANTNGKTQT